MQNIFSYKFGGLATTSVALCTAVLMLFAPLLASASELVPATTNQNAVSMTDLKTELSNAVNAAEFGYGQNTVPTKSGISAATTRSLTPVAILTVFADSTGGSSGYVSGHAFITVKNVSGSSITIGKLSGIANNKTVSLGTWGNKYEHTGLWYNLESYFVYNYGSWSNRKSVSYILTASELSDLNTYVTYNDSWSYLSPCSSFAAAAWNSAVDAGYSLSAGYPSTPANLKSDIMSSFPYSYQTGASVPWDYNVYYAQGTGTPVRSSVY